MSLCRYTTTWTRTSCIENPISPGDMRAGRNGHCEERSLRSVVCDEAVPPCQGDCFAKGAAQKLPLVGRACCPAGMVPGTMPDLRPLAGVSVPPHHGDRDGHTQRRRGVSEQSCSREPLAAHHQAGGSCFSCADLLPFGGSYAIIPSWLKDDHVGR